MVTALKQSDVITVPSDRCQFSHPADKLNELSGSRCGNLREHRTSHQGSGQKHIGHLDDRSAGP